jgi:hypothetical protein
MDGVFQRDAHSLTMSRGPNRLNLHDALLTRCIMFEAAPKPVLRTLHKATPHRISVNITQLLNPFLGRVDIEVVVPSLPEMTGPAQVPSERLFNRLNRARECSVFRFANEPDERAQAS